jgi:hypothetical protein
MAEEMSRGLLSTTLVDGAALINVNTSSSLGVFSNLVEKNMHAAKGQLLSIRVPSLCMQQKSPTVQVWWELLKWCYGIIFLRTIRQDRPWWPRPIPIRTDHNIFVSFVSFFKWARGGAMEKCIPMLGAGCIAIVSIV